MLSAAAGELAKNDNAVLVAKQEEELASQRQYDKSQATRLTLCHYHGKDVTSADLGLLQAKMTVLDLRCMDHLSKLSFSAEPAPFLRFLDLSWSALSELPIAVTNLPHLEVLRLRGCQNMYQLPAEIAKMPSLRSGSVILDFVIIHGTPQWSTDLLNHF